MDFETCVSFPHLGLRVRIVLKSSMIIDTDGGREENKQSVNHLFTLLWCLS